MQILRHHEYWCLFLYLSNRDSYGQYSTQSFWININHCSTQELVKIFHLFPTFSYEKRKENFKSIPLSLTPLIPWTGLLCPKEIRIQRGLRDNQGMWIYAEKNTTIPFSHNPKWPFATQPSMEWWISTFLWQL